MNGGNLYSNGKLIGSVDAASFTFTNFPNDIKIDASSFGRLNRTYTIEFKTPTIPRPPVEARKVTAESLGINLPGLTKIGIGGKCAGEGVHKSDEAFGYTVLAHAHVCNVDPDKGMVCTKEGWLKNLDGTYSDILLHELAHVLTDYSKSITSCGTSFDTHGVKMQDGSYSLLEGHGKKWQEWAVKFGVSPSPYGIPPLDKDGRWVIG